MFRIALLTAAGLLLAACSKEEPVASVPAVDLHGRLEVDEQKTAERQAQGIEGQYYRRVLTVEGTDLSLDDFLKRYCPAETRDETCHKAARIKKLDDVAGATRFLPNGL
ncbi:hypothetical protein GNE00_08405 [Pseudomonas sp. JL972]|uniref:hypothetical protein n=1 Tax=Stutzerimonas degradans TaxID=2968968 RepID=UPI0012D9A09A|nr:hypothetical protein [Stutzerimonas degradans]MCF6752863.1 hypothetical protein [Stutzerimonas stutzeri]MTZ13758.1 hypothetical protein [Stutzerimonas degradans]